MYQSVHLVAGEKLIIDAQFVPGDFHFNDEAIALLANSNGIISPGKFANTQDVINNGGNEFYTLTYTITATDDYRLLVGVADVADFKSPSTLHIDSISIGVPAGKYTILRPASDCRTTRCCVRMVRIESAGGCVRASCPNSGPAWCRSGDLLASRLISQDGGGLISQDGGGLISQDGGSLISQDGGGLISQDGGGLIVRMAAVWSATTARSDRPFRRCAVLAAGEPGAMNALQINAYKSASLNGQAGAQNYGQMDPTGSGRSLPTQATTPVPGLRRSMPVPARPPTFMPRTAELPTSAAANTWWLSTSMGPAPAAPGAMRSAPRS